MCTQKYLHYSQGFLYRPIRHPEDLYAMLQPTADIAATSLFVAADFYKSFPHRVVQKNRFSHNHRDNIVHQALAPTSAIFTYPLASLMYVLLQFHNSVQEVLSHALLLKLMEEKEVRTTTVSTKSMEPWTLTSLFVRVQSMPRVSWVLLGFTWILTATLPKINFKSLAASGFVFSMPVNSAVKLG